jgi:hypothetical protein
MPPGGYQEHSQADCSIEYGIALYSPHGVE